MRMLLVALSVLLFSSIIFVVGSEAIPTCTYRTSCNSGETCVFEVYQENNSHVGSCDSPYTTKVCCTEIDTVAIRSTCNAGEGGIMSLYATTNSHTGTSTYYSNIVCAGNSSTGNPMISNVRTSCLAREKCVVSVFQQNNTHVGQCDYYSNKLCVQEDLKVTITMILNTTQPNWGDVVQLRGIASRSDGTAVDTSADVEDVEVYMNSSKICTTDTNSTGGYTCNFTAPQSIGTYQLNVTVDDPTTSRTSWNTTTFTVVQAVGGAQTAESTSETVGCYEEPRIIQNPDGTINVGIIKICVFK